MPKQYMNELTARRVIEDALKIYNERNGKNSSMKLSTLEHQTKGLILTFDDETEFVVSVARIR
ncbi:hypothetical protein V7152_28315 [Neobacillus drentensis]|uniref:hypothetical protein n=1 Tax=Neobacillus drentensis TaxID=220684 RepID=UPI002FFEF447